MMGYRVLLPIVLAMLWLLPSVGCETYRVEYRDRPDYYHEAALGELGEQAELADGTTIVFRRPQARSQLERRARSRGDGKRFELREERDDGTIILRALLPEHVLANTVTCLQNEEYELLYEQMLSRHTREAWEAEGNNIEDFVAWCARNRTELIRTLNRMYMALPRHQAIMERIEHGLHEIQLRPDIASDLKFTRARIISEGYGLKLVNVR